MSRKRLFKDREELESRIQAYRDYIDSQDKPPTIAGASYFLGISRRDFYNYQNRDEFKEVIDDFRDYVLWRLEEIAINKGGAGVIFILKQYGYTDRHVYEQVPPLQINVDWQ